RKDDGGFDCRAGGDGDVWVQRDRGVVRAVHGARGVRADAVCGVGELHDCLVGLELVAAGAGGPGERWGDGAMRGWGERPWVCFLMGRIFWGSNVRFWGGSGVLV